MPFPYFPQWVEVDFFTFKSRCRIFADGQVLGAGDIVTLFPPLGGG